MNKSPYALDFLRHQIEVIKSNIKKPKYRELLNQIFENKDMVELFEKAKDKKTRNYQHGILERTASVGSLALCMYDNYPTIDIDLLLIGIILSGFRDSLGRPFFYKYVKEYPEIAELLYKKNRKKPKLEHFLFDELFKIDEKVINFMKKKEDVDGNFI
ncbi:hypothetical protein [Sulfurihydrogenibium subterraneum]|uniref:hypothetical protein n=1 Tax=Sulfurihydrogenibium subterraneum TaxID=171121 RepID=UPI0004917872|nr:hypothetical protein [Sulfurihydrogenibium subterraneum]